jgi:hypothetical protein
MGVKHIYEEIQKRREERKESLRETNSLDIEAGTLLENFIESDSYKVLQGVYNNLHDRYLSESLSNEDLKALAKTRVFMDIENEIKGIIAKGKTLEASEK